VKRSKNRGEGEPKEETREEMHKCHLHFFEIVLRPRIAESIIYTDNLYLSDISRETRSQKATVRNQRISVLGKFLKLTILRFPPANTGREGKFLHSMCALESARHLRPRSRCCSPLCGLSVLTFVLLVCIYLGE